MSRIFKLLSSIIDIELLSSFRNGLHVQQISPVEVENRIEAILYAMPAIDAVRLNLWSTYGTTTRFAWNLHLKKWRGDLQLSEENHYEFPDR